jgi:RNA polymerase sigma-70 factor, ECF subfamily
MRTLDPASLGKHVDRLYRAAWALCGSREDAEDLVQDTYARVLARPRKLRGDDELAYLMQVLRNTFLTGRRTAGRRPQIGATLDDFEAADPRSDSRPEEVLATGEVFTAIAALAEPFRSALVAVDVVGLSYREAARALGTQEATITTRLYRARQQVARAMAPAPDPSDARATATGDSQNAMPGHPRGTLDRAPQGPGREGADPYGSLA